MPGMKYKRHGKDISGQSLLESITVLQNLFSGHALLMNRDREYHNRAAHDLLVELCV